MPKMNVKTGNMKDMKKLQRNWKPGRENAEKLRTHRRATKNWKPGGKTAGKKANSEEFAEQKEKIVLIKDWLYRNNF